MYSVLPAIVSALFLGYGAYVVAVRGFNRVSTSFLVLCLTTFSWQATWSILFQVNDPAVAVSLAKAGYLLILFLPTSLYQFLVEISERTQERRWVAVSYAVAVTLAVLLLSSNWLVAGTYSYFWGYYPKAGWLHPLHVLQTVLVVNRGLYVTFRQFQIAPVEQRRRLRICMASVLIYFLAAVDYLCNYGVEFYPPGVVFIAISLGFIVIAATRYELMNPVAVAATVAHEIRTPLSSILMQAEMLARTLPDIHRGYDLAVAHGLMPSALAPATAARVADLPRRIQHQVARSTKVIDMVLSSARLDHIDRSTFSRVSAAECLEDALQSYPFKQLDRNRVSVLVINNFQFQGSSTLLEFLLFNLIKNALYAIQAADKGGITIRVATSGATGLIRFTDTGSGIPSSVLPRIFDNFYTTKKSAGAGIGLAFCRRVMDAFGGSMRCDSVAGQYTTFEMRFPLTPAEPSMTRPARKGARRAR
jgi:signal transduction histidine kinase